MIDGIIILGTNKGVIEMTFKEVLKEELTKWESARNNDEVEKANEIKNNFFRLFKKYS